MKMQVKMEQDEHTPKYWRLMVTFNHMEPKDWSVICAHELDWADIIDYLETWAMRVQE